MVMSLLGEDLVFIIIVKFSIDLSVYDLWEVIEFIYLKGKKERLYDY